MKRAWPKPSPVGRSDRGHPTSPAGRGGWPFFSSIRKRRIQPPTRPSLPRPAFPLENPYSGTVFFGPPAGVQKAPSQRPVQELLGWTGRLVQSSTSASDVSPGVGDRNGNRSTGSLLFRSSSSQTLHSVPGSLTPARHFISGLWFRSGLGFKKAKSCLQISVIAL